MKASKIIALLTDFGPASGYAGVMKGVILGIAPDAIIVDLAHDIPPQDVESAAYVLGANFKYFPPGTIFCAVVDPGVGTGRKAVCIEVAKYLLVCPDNGIASYVLSEHPAIRVVEIKNRVFMLGDVSTTFHGRDVFAPAAAYLARGLDPSRLGQRRKQIALMNIPRPAFERNAICAQVIYIDRFGNLITNITEAAWRKFSRSRERASAWVRVGQATIAGISRTYADAAPGSPLALFGSSGRLEISLSGASAADFLKVSRGAAVLAGPLPKGKGRRRTGPG